MGVGWGGVGWSQGVRQDPEGGGTPPKAHSVAHPVKHKHCPPQRLRDILSHLRALSLPRAPPLAHMLTCKGKNCAPDGPRSESQLPGGVALDTPCLPPCSLL